MTFMGTIVALKHERGFGDHDFVIVTVECLAEWKLELRVPEYRAKAYTIGRRMSITHELEKLPKRPKRKK